MKSLKTVIIRNLKTKIETNYYINKLKKIFVIIVYNESKLYSDEFNTMETLEIIKDRRET